MAEKTIHQIDFKQLSNLAHTGVRRAALFMGIGLNAAHRDDFKDYRLRTLPKVADRPSSIPIEFFPDELPDNQLTAFKQEFASWIIACGLREVIEHYAQLLDQLYIHGLIVLKSKGKLPSGFVPETRIGAFARMGLPDKFKALTDQFGMKIDGSECASDLYVARNALTHDLGLVTAKRAMSGTLKITWRGIDLVAIGASSGKEHAVADLVGKITPEDMQVEMRVADRKREFAVGSTIRLTHNDLSEICQFFAAVLIGSALKEFENFLTTNGVIVSPPK